MTMLFTIKAVLFRFWSYV